MSPQNEHSCMQTHESVGNKGVRRKGTFLSVINSFVQMRSLQGVTLFSMCLQLSNCASNGLTESASRPPENQSKGSWISEPPSYLDSDENSPLSSKTYWQTQLTELPMAISELETKTIIKLDDEMARYYAGPHYAKQTGTQPYLVRAVFWNYTGGFELFYQEGDLHVHHGSLGGIYGEKKLPLIVNLKQPPNRVFTYMSSAR